MSILNKTDFEDLYLSSYLKLKFNSIHKLRSSSDWNFYSYISSKKVAVLFQNWKNELVNYINKENIKVIKLKSPEYPLSLSQIHNPPRYLFCKGNIELLKNKIFAVIGSRHPTQYGVIQTQKFVRTLSENGFVTISGMAIGIDSEVHKSSINKGTIAVLGSGFKNIHPSSNYNLYTEIIEKNGLVITEYIPETMPFPQHFPARSRIIAGLADGLLVTEAAIKSGSLIGARLAFENNKNVYAIPGDVTRDTSEGCNELIKNDVAKIVTDPADILIDYEIDISKPESKDDLSSVDREIIILIGAGANDINLIAANVKLPVNELMNKLTLLEMSGVLIRQSGELYLNT